MSEGFDFYDKINYNLINLCEHGPFVYQLGHGPLKAERRVRFPYGLPYKMHHYDVFYFIKLL